MIEDISTLGFGLETTLRHAVDGMFILDRNRRIVFYSEACERIIGADRASAVGGSCPCHEITNCRDEYDRSLSGVLCPAIQVLSGERSSARQRMSVLHAQGHRVWVETIYSPIKDTDGMIIGAVGIMRDITEEKERAEQENASGDAAVPVDGSVPATAGGPLDAKLSSIERREILGSLGRARGQRTLAARMLGISRSRLYRRMEALGIDPRRVEVSEGSSVGSSARGPIPAQPGLAAHASTGHDPRQP